MKSERATFSPVTGWQRALLWFWCACFIGVTSIAPVSAAHKFHFSDINTIEHHDSIAVDSLPSAPSGLHQGEDLIGCSDAEQHTGCVSNCLHCYACYLNVAVISPTPLINQHSSMSLQVATLPAAAPPSVRPNPPYRPPIN